jgi:hypothetical protein
VVEVILFAGLAPAKYEISDNLADRDPKYMHLKRDTREVHRQKILARRTLVC